MNLKRILVFCLLGAGLNAAIFAQSNEKNVEKKNLTINDAVSLALENNISIQQSKLSLDLLHKQYLTSWNSVSPSINFATTIPVTENKHSVSASFNLTLQPAVASNVKSAALNYERGKVAYETSLRTVELNVRKGFYQLLLAQESIQVQKMSLEASEKMYKSNLEKYNRGQLSELDLLTSEYNYLSKKPSLESSISSYENSLSNFKQVLGLALSEEIELLGSVDDVLNFELSEDILSIDINTIPTVVTAQAAMEMQKTSLLATRFTAWGPTLSASYQYIFKSFDSFTNSYVTMPKISMDNLTISLNIPLDGLLPWSRGAMSVASQKEALEERKLALENAKTTAEISMKSSYNTILNAQKQLESTLSNLKLSEKTYEMMLKAYNNGSRDLLSLQNAELNLHSAQNAVQSQKTSLITAILDFENSLGLPFGSFINKK